MSSSRSASHEAAIREIAEIVDGPISAETVSLDTQGMLEEAPRFASWHPNVVGNVPSNLDGWAAVRQLKRESIRTNVTLCFSANQALFAALADADIISPFVGRLDDISEDGMHVAHDIVEIYHKPNLPTLALAASIRHPLRIIEAAKAGVDIASAPFKARSGRQCIH